MFRQAALQLKEDGNNPSPWRLCTVTQVEEVKILTRLIPIPTCTNLLNVILTEYLSLSVQQAFTSNTHMGHPLYFYDGGVSAGLAYPPLYFYDGGVREFIATIIEHVFLVTCEVRAKMCVCV